MSEIIDCIAWIVEKTCWSFYVFCQFILLRILDILGLIFNILACLTIIRLPCMIRQFEIMKELSEWRYVGFVQLLIFFIDIPFIFMALAVIFFTFGFVCSPMINEIREERIKCDYNHKNKTDIYFGGFKLRKLVARYFFQHITGILCIPLLFITLLSWRCVIVVRKLRPHRYFDWKWRKEILIQFFQLFIDMPCVFVGLIVVLSWRLPFYIKEVKKMRNENHGWSKWRFVAFEQFALLFVDMFCFFLFALTFITWRCPFMIKELRHDCKGQWEARTIVVQQFLLIFVDIPCIICFIFILVTMWRLPRFIKNFKYDQWEVRQNCVYQVFMLIIDFCSFILFLIIALTLWRLYPTIRDIRKYRRRYQLQIEQSGTQTETNVTSSPSSWKIRKAICKHIAFLLVDLPAMMCVFIIMITLFRLPSLLSKLLQSGDFYTEFAITVFTETGKLFIDIFFMIFFIILMILRPVASWVRLLEDKEHAQYRNVCFYAQWVPDIISGTRNKLPSALEEEFSSCLKEKLSYEEARAKMSIVCLKYFNEWEWLREKVLKYDLYPELPHLIDTLMWYEKRRPYKMSRLYLCELFYLSRPVPSVHDETLLTYTSEMAEFQENVSSAYKKVEDYSPAKVPLWSNKCGLFTRSRRETQKVLLSLPGGNVFLFILVFFNLLFIYRAPSLITNLYRRWYDRHSIIFHSCKEYLLDALAFLRILIVLLSLYRAPSLLLDITIDIFEKRSWKAVRATAKRYPLEILEDFALLISNIFHWRTIRFFFTAILFGIFIPADLLLTVLKLEAGQCCAYTITAFLFTTLLFFPFAFAFYFGKELLINGYGVKISYIISAYGLSIVLILVYLFYIFLRHRGTTFSVAPKPYDYIRINWANTHVVIFEIVELLQLVAIVFSIENIPIMGAEVLNTYANYLLFNFASFEVKLSLTLIRFFIWFIACGAPVIFEQILEDLDKGTCAANGGWRLLIVLFYNTLFVSMVEGLCGLVACEYVDTCFDNHLNISNTTCYMSSLVDDPATACWVGGHRIMALFGLWGLLWYTTTAILYGTQYGEVDSPDVDIEFSPVYNTIVNLLKALMVGAVVLISQAFYVVMVILLILCLVAILYTIYFENLIGYTSCNSTAVSIFRVASFVIFGFTVVAVIVAKKMNNENSYVPLIILLAGIGGTLLVAVATGIKYTKETETEKERKQFRERLLSLEEQLNKNGALVVPWKKQRQKWRRLVRHVYQAQASDRNLKPETWEQIPLPNDDYTAPPLSPPPPLDHDDPTMPECSYPVPPPPVAPLDKSAGGKSVPDEQETYAVGDTEDSKQNKKLGDVKCDQNVPPDSSNSSAIYEDNPTLSDYDLDEFIKYRLHSIENASEYKKVPAKMTSLQCNGKNLLLYFESFIHYRTFSFAFVSQIPLWRQAASGSNWTGLLHCLQVLQKSLTSTYNKPSELDISLGDISVPLCVLPADLDKTTPPIFVPEPRDPDSIKYQSDSEREKALADLQRICADEPIWITVFEKLLPTLPVIRKWNMEEESGSFELIMRRSCKATIVDVGPKGVKLAKGAVISLPKNLKGTLTNGELIFQKHFEPTGKKGPISVAVAVAEIQITRSLDKVYFYSNGKKINVEKALDSLKSIKWS